MKDDDASNIDMPSRTTDDWYYEHKRNRRAAGREPLSWGEWLRAGMPSA